MGSNPAAPTNLKTRKKWKQKQFPNAGQMYTSEKEFWNTVGSTKSFSDPFRIERFTKGLRSDSLIVEYGCGYGRILSLLWQEGFSNLVGFDFAPKMISRGKTESPHLDLRLLKTPFQMDLETASVDGIVLSTVLTCISETKDIQDLMKEINRVLKPSGLLYVSDFLITENEKYRPLYQRDANQFADYGTFMTSEGGKVRHFERSFIQNLMGPLDMIWYEEAPYFTMNLNPIETFHLMAVKGPSQ
ncbi:MAG: class I SAM-dependent methyltransferase [Bdellovibrio sp.]|nr:class I SAM-dependent methyltransferase [Bdellovibrio sp.]